MVQDTPSCQAYDPNNSGPFFYQPSLAAGIVFTALFFLSSCTHLIQAFRYKNMVARPIRRGRRCRMLRLNFTNSSIRMFLLNFAPHNANRTSNLRLVALSFIPRFPFIFEEDVNVDGYSSTSMDNSRSLHRPLQNGSHPRQKIMPLPTQNIPINLSRRQYYIIILQATGGGLAGQEPRNGQSCRRLFQI
jgi:hypothetical protein